MLINLGSPDTQSFWPVRRYLRQFLSDPRVVEERGPVRWMVLNGPILTRRPTSLARACRQIWDWKARDSPLNIITRAQAGR